MKKVLHREKCYKCYRPISSCVCTHIKQTLNTKSKFIILMHPKEFKKTKNGTGHMTNNSLSNCEIHIGIDFTNNDKINTLLNDDNYSPYLLYPGEKSIKLNTEKIHTDKIPLIFIIDSTWPCSKKILRESKNLQKIDKISFEYKNSSQFKIKTQPNQYCLSTIESTQYLLELLTKQNIESFNKNELEDFLNPFIKMIDYQENCAKDENNEVRYKIPYKKAI